MRRITMLLGLATTMALAGCPQPAAEEPEPEAEAPEPEPEPEPAEPMMKTMGVAAANAARADHVGKEVKGMFGGTAMEGEATHVTVLASGDEGAASLVCVAADAAAFAGMADKAELTVKGTVAEADKAGSAVLEGCAPHKEKAAAAGGDAMGGDDAEGGEGEGEGEGD